RLGFPAEPMLPDCNFFLIGSNVARAGYIADIRLEGEWKTHQRTMEIKLRNLDIEIDDLCVGIEALHQCLQFSLRPEQDSRAGVFQQPDVTADLNDVPEPLLPIDQDGLSRDVGLAQPQRLAPPAVSNGSPPPAHARLVTAPSDIELARQEMHEPSGVACLRIIGLQCERRVETLDRFIEALQFVQ